MYKVCDIRNVDLRTGLTPREIWSGYVRDLQTLMDRSVGDGAKNALSLPHNGVAEPRRAA